MRLLLDTHVLLWALGDPERLPPRVSAIIASPAHDVYVSPVATWEIAIKTAHGRLRADLDRLVRRLFESGFQELPVTVAHTLRLRDLPPRHRDPFDRLLIAQAIEDRLVLVSADSAVRAYPVQTLWDE